MNILYLHDALHGGAAESLLQLLRGRESCNEILLAYGTDGPVTDKLSSVAWKQPPIRLYLRSWLSYRPRGWRACLRFPFALAAHALSLVRLWLLCNRERVDVIHTNCVHLIEGALLARWLRVRHVWSVRELLDLDCYRYDVSKATLARTMSRHADVVLCNSVRAAEGLERLGVVSEKICVLPNIVGPLGPPLDLHARLQLPPHVRLVAAIGWITPIKNVEDFVVLAGELTDLDEDVRFLIIGSPTSADCPYYRRVLDTVRASPNRERILCTGPIENVSSYFASLSVLVHPGGSEAFGRVVAEAMMSGTPVVGVKGSAVEEIVEHGETGLLVAPGDIEAMATSCRALLGEPGLLSRMGEAGRRVAERRYSEEALKPQYGKLYGKRPGDPERRQSAALAHSEAVGSSRDVG